MYINGFPFSSFSQGIVDKSFLHQVQALKRQNFHQDIQIQVENISMYTQYLILSQDQRKEWLLRYFLISGHV